MALIPPLGPQINHSDVKKLKRRGDLSPTERAEPLIDAERPQQQERRKRGERRRKKGMKWRGKERRDNARRNATRNTYQRPSCPIQADDDLEQEDQSVDQQSGDLQKGQQIDITV